MKNQKGFSLIQAMIAVGIVGGLSLVLAQMMDTSNKQINYIDFKLSTIDFKKDLTYQMSFVENCVKTLEAGIISPANLKSKSLPVDKIQNSRGRALFKVGNTYHRDLILSGLTIKNFVPESPKITNQGVADLEYKLKAKKQVLGPTELTRNLRLEMYFDKEKHKMSRCRIMTDGASNVSSSFRATCLKSGGTYQQGDRCKFMRPKVKGRAAYKSLYGDAVAYNGSFHQIAQSASKNSHAFCNLVFGPRSFALSFYEEAEGRNNYMYIGTDDNELELKEFTSRATTTKSKIIKMILCSQ